MVDRNNVFKQKKGEGYYEKNFKNDDCGNNDWCYSTASSCYAGESIVEYNAKNTVKTVHEVEDSSRENIVIEPITGVLGEAYSNYSGNSSSTWSVIGTDSRTLVSNPNTRPYVAIAKLTITFPDGTVAVGTGYMISEYTMATAGHCLYQSKYGGLATSIVAEFGKAGTSSYVKVENSHVEKL